MSDMLRINVLENGDRVELTLTGPLDSQGSSLLRDEGRQQLQRGVRALVVDCASVTFISSSGVGAFLVLQDEFEDGGKLACYRNPSPEVRSVIRLMDLENFLNIVGGEDETLKLLDCGVGPLSKDSTR